MLKVRQVADLLGVSAATVYRLVGEGRLPHYRVGCGRGGVRFRRDEVDGYVAACRRGPAPAYPAAGRPAAGYAELSGEGM